MTTETGVTSGGEPIFSTELPADAPEAFNSPSEAAEYFTSLKQKKSEPAAESANEATAEHESTSQEDDAAPDADQAHGEDKEPDPAAEPPIERPKSWTESEEAEWRATPRALQQKIAARELERDTALRRTQNDAAEKLKGLTAKEQQAEQVRQQYEAKLADQMQSLLDYNDQQFAAIKSQSDVDYLASEALRLAQSSDFGEQALSRQYTAFLNSWQVHQQKMAGKKAELDKAEGEKSLKQQAEWQNYRQAESTKATALIPELADEKKGPELMAKAAKLLRDVKFSQEELNALDNGGAISPFDHRMQSIIADAVRYRDIMAAKAAVAAKPVPPVVRPGTSRPSGQGVDSERIQALNRKPELTVNEATELYMLQQRASRRA